MSEKLKATDNRIVVGVDGSWHSQHALRWAAFLARPLGAQLQIVTAWEYPATYQRAAMVSGWNPSQATTQMIDETISTAFAGKPPTGLKREVCEGSAAEVLLKASEEATLLVVGSRGHGGFTGLLLGSVSASVAEHAPCPVLIIHGDQEPPPSATA